MGRYRMKMSGAVVLQISGTPVTTATQNSAYTGFTVGSTGGVGSKTYSVASGTLPTGITLNSSTGVISGTPTGSGTSSGIVIRVTDSKPTTPNTADLASFSIAVTASSSLLTAGASWTGTQNSGFGGSAPADPTRTTAKPTLRPLWPDHFVTFNNYTFVVDSGALGGIASVAFTLEGGTPVTKTSPELVTYTDANGVSRTVYGYAAQIDNAAVIAQSASGTATLSIEAIASDGTMQHRVMNYSIYPRATEFTDTITVGASGKTVTTIKAALALAAAAGPAAGSPKRYCIQLADNNTDYDVDSQNTDYTTVSWWTVITTAPGVTTATIGDGTRSQTFPGFGGICFRGSAIKWDIAKLGWTLKSWRFPNSGSRIWFDGCEITCGTPSAAQGGGGSGANALFRGTEPNQFWLNGNDSASSFEIYYTEVNAHDIPAYGLSFHKLRRNSTVTMCGGSDDENSYCTHGGYGDQIGGYWTGQRTYQGAFDLTYTGSATLAQFEKTTQPGYPGNFNLYEDSGTPTYTFAVQNEASDSNWQSMTDLITWINSKTGWHATATTSTTALGATYVVLNSGSLTAALPKTTANATPVAVKRAADVHADMSVWTNTASVENVSKRFFGQRRGAGVDLFSVPDSGVTAKDWCHRNYFNSDISASVSESSQPSVPGGQFRHAFWEYISCTNPSGWVFSGSYDAYCNMDHSAGKFTWSGSTLANMSWTSCFFQQSAAPGGAGSNCTTSNVASSTLYTDYSATVPDFTPINGGTHPLRLTDTTWAGRYLPTGAEQLP